MKKLFILFLCLCVGDSFATGIGNVSSAPCDNDTLSKYTGTANIEINWEPNVIGLRWSNGNEQINGQTSCTYDGTITVPPQPTKLGYTFKGWKVDHSCGLKNVDTAVNATWRCSLNPNGRRIGSNCQYTLTENGTYAVLFDYGIVLGEVLCSTTRGNAGIIGTPDTNDTGNYCWCRITGYIWPEGGLCSTTSGWMYENLNSDDIAAGGTCESHCAGTCAYRLNTYEHRRIPLYNSLPE